MLWDTEATIVKGLCNISYDSLLVSLDLLSLPVYLLPLVNCWSVIFHMFTNQKGDRKFKFQKFKKYFINWPVIADSIYSV